MQINSIPANTQPEPTSADLLAQSIIYSANVGGKTYTADLNLTAGEYVARIPDLPTINASGSSLILAENNLEAKLNLLA